MESMLEDGGGIERKGGGARHEEEVLIEEEDDEEEEQPDYRKLAGWLNKSKRDHSKGLPARGIKDFEPVVGSESQSVALEESRKAMYDALNGSRQHTVKNANLAIWEDDPPRAHLITIHGILHQTMGHSIHGRPMLYPEEAVYLCERGTLKVVDLVRAGSSSSGKEDDDRSYQVPLSLEQLWSRSVGRDGLTMENYQIYAHLKRLGYIVIRPEPSRLSKALDQAKLEEDTRLHQGRVASFLTYCQRFIHQICQCAITPLRFLEKRLAGQRISMLLPLDRWKTYGQVFSALRIEPRPRKRVSSTAQPLTPRDQGDVDDELRVSWYVYKPGTKYKRSAPPLPDFEVVVVDTARHACIPTMTTLDRLFSEKIKPLDTTIGLKASPKAQEGKARLQQDPTKQLKMGSRTMIFAIVDQGTTSFFQIGDTNFKALPLIGD